MVNLRPRYTAEAVYYGKTTEPVDVFCVQFSPDGAQLAASFSDGSIRIFNSQTGAVDRVLEAVQAKEPYGSRTVPIRRMPGAEATPLTDAAPTPAAMAVGSADAELDGLLDIKYPTTQIRWRPALAESKTRNVLLSVNAESNGRVQHWHAKSGKLLHTAEEKGNQIFCVDYSHDGTLFATAGSDRVVRVYDEATRRVKQEMSQGDFHESAGHSNRIFAVNFFPGNANMLVTGGWDNTIQVWDLRKGTAVRSIFGAYLCGDALRVTADCSQVISGSWRSDKSLQVWDLSTGKLAENVKWQSAGQPADQHSSLFNVDLSHDAETSWVLAAGSGENELKLFERKSGGAEAFVSVMSPAPIFSAAFNPSDDTIAFGGADGRVRVYDVVKA